MIRKSKRMLLRLLVLCLFMSGAVSLGSSQAAADDGAFIEASQISNRVEIKGKTHADDPELVPLIVTDSAGQILYVQEVAGGNEPLSLAFTIPTWAKEGKALVTLYSLPVLKAEFTIYGGKKPGKQKMTIITSITGYDGEEILAKTVFQIKDNASVFDLLKSICSENDFDLAYVDPDEDGHDVYIKSINGLAEFDKGAGSGWIYRVNGVVPQMPLDRYLLDDGDKVEFIYTSDFGNTESGTGSTSKARLSRSSNSDEVVKALSQLTFASDAKSIVNVVKDMLFNLAEKDVEKQKTYIPDVTTVLQAALERAATLPNEEVTRNASKGVLFQDISSRLVRDLLAEQQEVKKGLTELLDTYSLYKPGLKHLQPTLVVPISEKDEFSRWKLSIPADVWLQLWQAKARLAVVYKDWRTDLVPKTNQINASSPLFLTITFYSDRQQTEQTAGLPANTVPLTASYRLELSQPSIASYVINWPETGVREAGTWPTLYSRQDERAEWRAEPVWVAIDDHFFLAAAATGGDLMIASARHAFADVLDLPKSAEWAKEPITALSATGVIRGVSSTTYGVQAKLSRTDAIALLKRLTGKEVSTLPDSFQGEMNEPITRAELAVLVWQSASLSSITTDDEQKQPGWKDEALIPVWAKHAVFAVAAKGWLQGRTDGRFDPQASLTRAEVAAVLFRIWKDQATSLNE